MLQRRVGAHVGQLMSACSACSRSSAVSGCRLTALMPPSRLYVAGSIHRQVSEAQAPCCWELVFSGVAGL